MDLKQTKAIHEIKQCAARLGSTPTQAQFDQDPQTKLKARTVASYFPGGWKEALQSAELERGASDQELLQGLSRLAEQLDRMPTSRDINRCPELPSTALYIRRFGSIGKAREMAGVAELDRSSAAYMVEQGLKLSRKLGHLPSWSDWEEACASNPSLPSQWQVYRRFGGGDGAWKMFHYCLLEAGAPAN